MSQYNIAVMIGRFQPAHSAHIEVIRRALDTADNLVILIGSDNKPRTPKNPFLSQEREELIRLALKPEENKRVTISYIEDSIYNTQKWVSKVQDTVAKATVKFPWRDKSPSVVLVGHHKDDSSVYLDMFPQWGYKEIENINDLHSTDVRQAMFETESVDRTKLPNGISVFLERFMETKEFEVLKQEYEYTQRYKKEWSNTPYPPIFVTTDAVVVQSGHILMVTRGLAPGKGLLALPGGFINPEELLEDCMLRELREETKLKVPTPVLRGNIKKTEVFDSPLRSSRGRTITNAFLIELPAGPLPKVKGGSDANKAQWIPLNEVYQLKDKMFEDHHDIILKMIGDR